MSSYMELYKLLYIFQRIPPSFKTNVHVLKFNNILSISNLSKSINFGKLWVLIKETMQSALI